jgi:beta-lactam-binding protein with PASTA domain
MSGKKSFIVLLAILTVLGLCRISHADSASVSVPYVVNMAQIAATTALATAGLAVGTVVNQTNATVPAGSVFSQVPAAGTTVALGRLVNLFVSLGPAITVPNVVGQTQAAATAAITAAGLTVGTVTARINAMVPAGSVISQSPGMGVSVAPGKAVNLAVSLGPPVKVPNVVGQTQAAATTAIRGARLTVGSVTEQASSTIPAGSVISQSPAAKTRVAAATAVDLVVSSGLLDVRIHVEGLQGYQIAVYEGRTSTIQVRLDREPPSTIVVSASIAGSDPDILVVGGSTLAFTPSNWAATQPVTIAALPDEDMVDDYVTLRFTSELLAPLEVRVHEADGYLDSIACLSLAALSDVNGNGAPDLAELRFKFNPDIVTYTMYRIVITDGRTRKIIRTLTIDSNWLPLSIAVLNQNGSSTLAVLERYLIGDSVRCELIDAFTGVRGAPIPFGAPYAPDPKALAALPDMNGNGSMELAVLGSSWPNDAVQIIDSQTQEVLNSVLCDASSLYAFGAVPDVNGNGSSELILVDWGQELTASILDTRLGTVEASMVLREGFAPTGVTVVPDLNGDSVPEVAILGSTGRENKAAVIVKDPLTRSTVRYIPFGLLSTSSFVAIPDLGGNRLPALAAVGTGIKGGLRIEIRDALTGALIKIIGLTGTSAPRGMALLPDLNGAGSSALAVLRLDKSTGASSIEIIDAATGLLIPPLP